jgi:DNA-directed RNA polymerase subunit RPC12/RpoP
MGKSYVMAKVLYKCVRCQATIEVAPTLCSSPEIINSRDDGYQILASSNILHGCNETEIGVCTFIGCDVIEDE